MSDKRKSIESQAILDTVSNYKRESDLARGERIRQNQKNYEMYHLKQDYSHKVKGQSREFLPRQSMAVEQIAQFLHQGLADLGEFFSADPRSGVKNSLFTKDEARKLLAWQLEKAGFYNFIGDAIKSGLLGSLMIAKYHKEACYAPKFFTRVNPYTENERLYRSKKEHVQLKIDLVRQRDYFPDPTAEGLYKMQRIEKDLWYVLNLAKKNPETFDPEAIEMLKNSLTGTESDGENMHKAKETGQSPQQNTFRKRVELMECWGTLLDSHTGEVIHERAVTLVAQDKYVIMPPTPYPYWTNEDPFVAAPLIRVPHSVWHRALMDAPTALNQTQNEIFNLIIDGGIQAVFGIKQVREHWLEDPGQIADGVFPGISLSVNQSCPPGQKVIERVDTGNMSQEGTNAFELAGREFNQSALTNDLRLGGMPSRAVKATEVVEASQSITSVFTGVGKSVESEFIEPGMYKAWGITMQDFNNLDPEELKAILGAKRAKELLAIPAKQRFAKTVNGHQFRVFGITQTLNKIKDFRKLTALLQTVFGNPFLQESFIQKYDPTKFLKKIMEGLDIDVDEIKNDAGDQMLNDIAAEDENDSGPPQGGSDLQSQIPQAATGNEGSEAGLMPQTEFPVQ
jgi:hypothetical protein